MKKLRQDSLEIKRMKFIFIIYKIIFLILFIQNNSFAKGLPPGTGESDIPANVLILLDKSGSMGTGPGTLGMNRPEAVAIDSSTGDFYVANNDNFIVKFIYDTLVKDDTWADGQYSGTDGCQSNDVKELRIHGGKLYVAAYNSNKVFRIDLVTAACDWNVDATDVKSLTIKDDILYSFGSDLNIFDLSGGTPQQIACSYGAGSDLETVGKVAEGLAIDSSFENLYFHNSSTFYRFAINAGTKCPSETQAAEFDSPDLSRTFSMMFMPGSDVELFVPDYHDELLKYEINSSKDGIVDTIDEGSYVGTAASSAGNLFVDYPYGMDIDTTNNRIVIVSRGSKSAALFIDFSLNFVAETEVGPTRMDGAIEAITALVQDSSLTSHVDFGFGIWAGSGGSFTTWTPNAPPEPAEGEDPMTEDETAAYGITYGTASPCSSSNCLKVRVHPQGFTRIAEIISEVTPGGSTSATSFANIAEDYYLHTTLSPVDDDLECQDSYVIVIGDGDFTDDNEVLQAIDILSGMAGRPNPIKSFMVAYGGDVSSSGLVDFNSLAAAGGTEATLIADTPGQLKTQLRAKITEVIAEKLAFTPPSVPLDFTTDGSLYQSSFHYKQNKEWRGQLIRTSIDKDGNVNEADIENWVATAKMPAPSDRKIWTTLPGADYKDSGYNNFVVSNLTEIQTLFRIFNYTVDDYHSITSNPVGTRRCAGTSGVEDGNVDDQKGIIKFSRGEDYFDYDADCILSEKRVDKVTGANVYLGDIYHSELIVVGAPSASVSYTGNNQESYWRYIKGYSEWAEGKKDRKKIIYVGANDGMLHAFNASSGVEEWAFIPPFMAAKFPSFADGSLNDEDTGGGSVAIYGVDGSPTVHDMYFNGPLDSSDSWHTILMIPYGRGGNGFSILDITDPDNPLHLFSVYNDTINHAVHVVNHLSAHTQYPYATNSYNISSFEQAKQAQINFDAGNGTQTCDETGNTQCYLSNTWTLVTSPQIPNLTKEDFKVGLNGADYDDFIVSYDGNGDLIFTFGSNIRYAAYDNPDPASSQLGIRIVSTTASTGVQTPNEHYDYSKLGESWSSPRIIRLPLDGSSDTNINDNPYVAIMGGGYGTQNLGVGSNLFIINLEDTTGEDEASAVYGKVEKVISIEDESNTIVNSTPGLPVVITPDTSTGISFTGALVYLNDLEGKITKINLTNMPKDNLGSAINLYDHTTLFKAGSSITNGRYMYHSMEAGIGKTTGKLWLFTGTGNYHRLTEKSGSISNLLLGIKDVNFPYYKNVNTAAQADDLTKCTNTTPTEGSSTECPKDSNLGWYITLDNSEKVSAEPTISKGTVYFPIYRPSVSENQCSMGFALICAVDDECGNPVNDKIGSSTSNDCRLVGQGVLSKIIFFADKLFANIAGEGSADSIQGGKSDLISIGAADGEIETYRSSWRENY